MIYSIQSLFIYSRIELFCDGIKPLNLCTQDVAKHKNILKSLLAASRLDRRKCMQDISCGTFLLFLPTE
jgi:hypothetical protein